MNKHKIIKGMIYALASLLIVAIGAYGVMTSDFSKIKKYDEKDNRVLTKNNTPISKEKQKLAKTRYYSTKVKVQNNGIITLGDFTMNLSGNKILTANISLKYKDNDDSWLSSGKTQKEILKKSDVLRSSVIHVMFDSTATTNSDKVKENIKNDINQYLSNGEVEEVYFNKFIIQ